jgi:hypothetical protein
MKNEKSALNKVQKENLIDSIPSSSVEDQFNEKAFNLNGSLKHERKLNVFKWLPKHERPSQFPLLPKPYWPNKETRNPLFWGVPIGNAFWFVNLSTEILPTVGTINSVSTTSADDESLQVAINRTTYYYENVLPNEAVLVKILHPFYDSDLVFQVELEVQSNRFGKMQMKNAYGSGEQCETVFIWETEEIGKNATVVFVNNNAKND